MVSMLMEDLLGASKVGGLHPNFGLDAWNVADAGVQVVPEYLTANAISLECLLPDVGLKRVRGSGKANDVVLILRVHCILLSR
jgi:hypothetical protein